MRGEDSLEFAQRLLVKDDLVNVPHANAGLAQAKLHRVRWLRRVVFDAREALFPCGPFSYEAKKIVSERTTLPIERPGENATFDQRRAYAQQMFTASAEWITRWPEHDDGWRARFYAINSYLPETPLDVAKPVADTSLSFWREYPDNYSRTFPQPPQSVASFFLERRVNLGEIPALLTSAQNALDQASKRADSMPESFRDKFLGMLRENKRDVLRIETELALINKDEKVARAKLAELDKSLQTEKKPGPAEQATVMSLRAKLHRFAGHKADALAHFVKAESLLAAAKGSSAQLVRAKNHKELESTWKELGGSLDTLPMLKQEAQAAPAEEPAERWEAVNKALPAFALEDLDGKQWTLQHLKGKVTFVNVWATWCKPCQLELPHVEKLRALAKAKNIQVLSFNVDDNPGAVAPFITAQKLTMPILLAKAFVEGVTGIESLPRSWLVDRNGMLVQQHIGFSNKETWAEEMLKQLEAFAARSPKSQEIR